MANRRALLVAVVGLLAYGILGAAASPQSTPATDSPDSTTQPNAWRSLERLRAALAADGTLQAEFEQSYVPAGFEFGDTESGIVALAMPDCLRWDYVDPYRKSFLVCGDRAWSWVEGEPLGQRFTIEAEREIGLDLLLLPAVNLKTRYRAQATKSAPGLIELQLEPLAADADLVAANLVIASDGRRPLGLEWRDREGSVTSFRFSDWKKLASHEAFEPPVEIEWSDPTAQRPVR